MSTEPGEALSVCLGFVWRERAEWEPRDGLGNDSQGEELFSVVPFTKRDASEPDVAVQHFRALAGVGTWYRREMTVLFQEQTSHFGVNSRRLTWAVASTLCC